MWGSKSMETNHAITNQDCILEVNGKVQRTMTLNVILNGHFFKRDSYEQKISPQNMTLT